MLTRILLTLAGAACVASGASGGDGQALYLKNCASCHEALPMKIQDRSMLRVMSPEYVERVLTTGVMRAKAAGLTPQQRTAIAEFVSGRPIKRQALAGGQCAPADLSSPEWNGWGADITNTRFQPRKIAGLGPDQIKRLQLRWAFGFPDQYAAWAQPAVAGGRVLVGSAMGHVYSLDARSGTTCWTFDAGAPMRTGITLGPNHLAYFGDLRANAFAIDALTGKLIWKTNVETHPFARITGTPQLFGGKLYVPVASNSENLALDETVRCCNFRGSVVALDAATGQQLWKTWTIPDSARVVSQSKAGFSVEGPSGAPVWTTPTIDAKRGVVYVGTGNNYSDPATSMSDSILALDLNTGSIVWARQLTRGDTLNGGCYRAGQRNCPQIQGPDEDFAASPVLITLTSGRRMLIAGQKSGMLYGLDPDKRGETIWHVKLGDPGEMTMGGIVWGPAVSSDTIWVSVSDLQFQLASHGAQLDPKQGGGLFAIRASDGAKVWSALPSKAGCWRPGCTPAQPAAITAIPGVVFSGSLDGHMRAYSSGEGKLLWDYDTIRNYQSVNGIVTRGGSINGPGPTVANGMVFVSSGYGFYFGFPGNALLAFAPE